jgi:type IV secretory pathway VirB2 component (pilin)
MLGNVATILQQIAQALTTGTFITAVATIAIAIVGFMWAMGYMGFRLAAGVVLGIAIVGSAATIASTLVSG